MHPIVVFVPRRSLPPDEPYRLIRNPNGSLSIAVAQGTTITADFVQLLIDVTERRAASPEDDTIGPCNVVLFPQRSSTLRLARPAKHQGLFTGSRRLPATKTDPETMATSPKTVDQVMLSSRNSQPRITVTPGER
jgi:hypothetical protein